MAEDEIFQAGRALDDQIQGLYQRVKPYISEPQLEKLARKVMGREGPPDNPLARAAIGGLIMDLALFATAVGGRSTPMDRLARQETLTAEEQQAYDHLAGRRTVFLEGLKPHPRGGLVVRDLVTQAEERLLTMPSPTAMPGARFGGRVIPLAEGVLLNIGPLLPFPDDWQGILPRALAVSRDASSAQQERALTSFYAAAAGEALAMSDLLAQFMNPGEEEDEEEEDEERHPLLPGILLPHPILYQLLDLAEAWARTGQRGPQDETLVRELASGATLINLLVLSASMPRRGVGPEPQRQAVAEQLWLMARLQGETLALRERHGYVLHSEDRLEVMAQILRDDLAVSERASVMALFQDLQREMAPLIREGVSDGDSDLARVRARIQALQEKTVAQGCTEAEALAAAEKISELLSRYDLDLDLETAGETSSCQHKQHVTSRRRTAEIDETLQAVAEFCDCAYWFSIPPDSPLTLHLFGLPADVAAAAALCEAVEKAFQSEVAAFKKTDTYQATPSAQRARATRSFKVGMSHGINERLRQVRDAREQAAAAQGGRSLVPMKEERIHEDMMRMGLRLRSTIRQTAPVQQEAHLKGLAAGRQFNTGPGLSSADS